MDEETTPAAFTPYEVPGVGTVIEPEGVPGYRVRLPSGEVQTFPALSGDPSEANAAADIAHAIANPTAAPFTLTRLEFLSRLTDAEKLAILTASDAGAVIFRTMFLAANVIDSADPRMTDGLAYLEALGLLAPGRPAELLIP